LVSFIDTIFAAIESNNYSLLFRVNQSRYAIKLGFWIVCKAIRTQSSELVSNFTFFCFCTCMYAYTHNSMYVFKKC